MGSACGNCNPNTTVESGDVNTERPPKGQPMSTSTSYAQSPFQQTPSNQYPNQMYYQQTPGQMNMPLMQNQNSSGQYPPQPQYIQQYSNPSYPVMNQMQMNQMNQMNAMNQIQMSGVPQSPAQVAQQYQMNQMQMQNQMVCLDIPLSTFFCCFWFVSFFCGVPFFLSFVFVLFTGLFDRLFFVFLE